MAYTLITKGKCNTERICGYENVHLEGPLLLGTAVAENFLCTSAKASGGLRGRQNKKGKEVKIMRYKIRLDTMAEVNRFVGVATKHKGSIVLTDGEKFSVNGKSLLGAMYTFEWDEIYCESETEIYHLIKDFIVGDSLPVED